MIAYNTTIKIDAAIRNEWVQWAKDELIPHTMSTGLFSDYKLFRLLDEDESEGETYVIQYFTSSVGNYKNYIERFHSVIQTNLFQRWGDRFISFHTVMETVN